MGERTDDKNKPDPGVVPAARILPSFGTIGRTRRPGSARSARRPL